MGLIYHILQPPVKRPVWLRLAVLGMSLGLAFALRIWLEPWLRWHSPFALLLPAVLVSAWYGGARAGLLATALGGIGAVYVFLTPLGFFIRSASDAAAFLLFIAEGAVFSGLCGMLHHALERNQASVTDAARKFEAMANGAPVLIWSTDASGRCVFVNRQWLFFTGRTQQQEIGSGWTVNVHPDDLSAYRQTYATAMAHKRPCQLEYRLRRVDGTYRWLLERAEPRYNDAGQFEGFTGSCTDITASRREREELDFLARLQHNLSSSLDLERLAAVLAEAAVPQLADWACLELVHDNDRLEVIPVPPPAGATGSTPPFATPGPSARVVETGEAQLATHAEAGRLSGNDDALRQRLAKLGLVSHLAVPLVARGRIIGVLTLATAASGRLLGAEELAFTRKIAGIAGFALDNARLYRRSLRALAAAEQARQQMAAGERALGRQRALLQSIIDAVPALIAYIGPDGNVLLHNERFREWLGADATDVAGRPFALAAGSGVADVATTHLRTALAGETAVYEDVIRAGAAERHVAAILLPDRDARGRVRGVVFHAYDVTDRRKAFAELTTARELLRCHADELEERVRQRTTSLRETNAELEAFTYSVSHDLRTPLQFVRSFAEAITEDTANALSPDSADYLERIVRAAARMESIIHDLLGYSRLARSDMALAPVALEDAVAEAVSHHQTAIQRAGAQVLVDSPLPQVMADRVGLFQILTNLVSNSLKFTVPGRMPVIRFDAEAGPSFTRLWVSDNGIGIPTRHQEKIFQLFERLHTAAEYPGTGIGLALVRKAAARMGGQCGVESAPGTGSRFWIDFPSVETAATPPSVAATPGDSRMRN